MQVWPTLAKSVLLALILSVPALAAQAASGTPNAPALSASDFGTPPSGEIPILYNDHTVYTKPDVLRKSRVLAAFVKDHQIYVPLRSMFEQMGATVTASADGKTFTATKPGSTVTVALGSSNVTINGETRPLDVPPILYHGIVLVPVRVISEALGAYVLWVSNRHLVVVRYIPAVPPPPATPAPTPAPVVTPTPSPTPSPVPGYHAFVQAAFSDSKNYNEFAAGADCPQSYLVSAALLFANSPLAVKVDFRQDAYVTSDNLTFLGNHYTRFNTIDGGTAFTPVFLAKQSAMDARLLFQIAAPKVYVGLGYLQTTTNYGYPKLTGIGVGIEKLPDLRKGFNLSGSAFYYPTATGDYTVANALSPNNGVTYRQQYQITKYDIGASLVLGSSPVYLYGGFSGIRYTVKQNAPIGQTHDGPYLGLGVKI
jgi:hypothetical protein